MRCKYIYKNGFINGKQCEREAEPGSEYCFWHEPTNGKNLEGKEIKEKNLIEAYLVEANLKEVKCERETNLSFGNFQKANLVKANLQGTNLMKVNLQGANLEEANLEETNLEEANLHNAYLYRARLTKAKLRGTNLQGASLNEANLQRADLLVANLHGSQLSGANLQGIYAPEVNFSELNLFRVNFQGAYLSGANFGGCDLRGADFQGCVLSEANFQEANLMGANLKGAFLFGVSFKNIRNLRYANFSVAIEEIIGATLLRLGVAREEDTGKYIDKFAEIIGNSLPLDEETKENRKKLGYSIFAYAHVGNIYNIGAVLRNSGRFYQAALDIYLNLKNYFRDDGLYDRSGDFFVREWRVRGKIQKINFLLSFYSILFRIKYFFNKINRFIRKDKQYFGEYKFSSTLSKDLKDLLENLFGWIGNIILRATSLYGESPLRVILTAISTILIYALIYAAFSGVAISSNSHIAKSILDYIYFSIGTFLTMSYGELIPTTSIRLVAESEAFCGAFLLAYFVVVVSRKIMR
jgi:uncharacterized protein YjbI with pentapeptide repeats